MKIILRSFSSKLDDIDAAQKALDEGAKVGYASIQVAAYDVPDSHIAAGNSNIQVIDKGAFRSFASTRDFENRPVPFFVDHGDFINKGYTDSALKIGKSEEFHDTDYGLVFRGAYNLQKQVARDAFSDLLFDPMGTQFSFRNYVKDEERYRSNTDGSEHVRSISDIIEVTQCPFGAQAMTGALVGSITARSAIRAHSTETDDQSWDEKAEVARLSADADHSVYRQMYAWVDPDEDPDEQAAYRFPHHEAQEGHVHAANLQACRQLIEDANEGKIPQDQAQGVYEHAARHLSDAGETPEPLRVPAPTEEQLSTWANDSEAFRQTLAKIVAGDEVHAPSMEAFRAMVDKQHRFELIQGLRIDDDLKQSLRQVLEESDRPAAVEEFLATVWKTRTTS